MRAEWAEASVGRRILFALSGVYWGGMLVLLVLGVASGITGYEAGRLTGLYFAPLVLALVIRIGFVLLSRRRPRPRIISWWVLVIGALIGVVLALQRAVVLLADRAAA